MNLIKPISISTHKFTPKQKILLRNVGYVYLNGYSYGYLTYPMLYYARYHVEFKMEGTITKNNHVSKLVINDDNKTVSKSTNVYP